MAKFIIIDSNKLDVMTTLLRKGEDGLFTILNEFNDFVDICQYSSRYDNLHVVAVKKDKLNLKKCIDKM